MKMILRILSIRVHSTDFPFNQKIKKKKKIQPLERFIYTTKSIQTYILYVLYTQIDRFYDLIFFKCFIFKNGGFSRVIRGLNKK